jgi:hypothetical protein
VTYVDDEAILRRVDDTTWLLLERLGRAFLERDDRWLRRYGWFIAIVEQHVDVGGRPS